MNHTLQTIIVFAAIAFAVLYLATRNRKKSCSGGCGCSAAKPPLGAGKPPENHSEEKAVAGDQV